MEFRDLLDLDLGFKLSKKQKLNIKTLERMVRNKQIPYRLPHFFYKSYSSYMFLLREKVIEYHGEVMSGTGSLSYVLRKLDIDIIATDDYSWSIPWEKNGYEYTDIENIDAIEAVEKYGRDVDILIMSWAYMDNTAYQVLKKLHEVNPNCILLYIGEGGGGCTADSEFYNNIINYYDETFKKVRKNYFQWNGLHDYPRLVKYNPAKEVAVNE